MANWVDQWIALNNSVSVPQKWEKNMRHRKLLRVELYDCKGTEYPVFILSDHLSHLLSDDKRVTLSQNEAE